MNAGQGPTRRRTVLAMRVLGVVLLSFLLVPLTTSAAHASTSPDVHVTGVDQVCGNDVTVFEFRLANLGEKRRGVRVRVKYDTGFTSTAWHPIRAGRRPVERVRVKPGHRATVTIRSQRQVIMRAPLVGDCPTKADTV